MQQSRLDYKKYEWLDNCRHKFKNCNEQEVVIAAYYLAQKIMNKDYLDK